eukprot:4632939-Amphidinium_carterae.1
MVMLGGGDDTNRMPKHLPCPCGAGMITEFEHFECWSPPPWLCDRVRFAAGKDGPSVPPVRFFDAYFHKRKLTVIEVGGKRIPVQMPDPVDALAGFVTPDKPLEEPSASLVHLPRAYGKLFAIYTCRDAFSKARGIMERLLDCEGLNLKSPIF